MAQNEAYLQYSQNGLCKTENAQASKKDKTWKKK